MDGDFARALLGVHPHATQDEIQHAFRRAVRRVHPDHGGSAEQFRALVEARECLLPTAEVSPAPRPTGPNPFADAVQAPASGWSVLDRPRPTPAPTVTVPSAPVSFDEVLAAALQAA